MTFTADIVGGSGYVGGELLRLLAAHPHIQVRAAIAESQIGQPFASVHPHLALAYPMRNFEHYKFAEIPADPANAADIVFSALPHGVTQKFADLLFSYGDKVVDLGADFRLNDAANFEDWYGEPHLRPDLLGSFVYGLPELYRADIKAATRVAAPGCYPTAANLALKPLIDAGAIEPRGIIVDAASGVSGAGRLANAGTHFCAVDGSFRAYGLTAHRHTAEMEMVSGASVLFTPHLMAASRGILATCYATAIGAPDPLAILRAAYVDEPFVHVGEALPETKWATGSNAAFLSARYDQRTNQVIALAAIDNLGKGAAGQMVQCANLMLGLDETAGLSNVGIYP